MASSPATLKDHFTAVHRLLAVIGFLDVVEAFKRDHALMPRHAEMLDLAVEKVESTLKEAEEIWVGT